MDGQFTAWLAGATFGMTLVVLLQVLSIRKQAGAISRVDAKLNLLLRHAGLEYDPCADVPQDVAQAVQAGDKILAIKRYREATGAGLKTAKEFVEELLRREESG